MTYNMLWMIVLLCLAIANAVCLDYEDKVLNIIAVIFCSFSAGFNFALMF